MQYLCQPFASLSEFAAGNNDDCGPNSEEVALASVAGRKPSAQHMKAIRTRDINEGWLTPQAGEPVDAISKDVATYEHIPITLLAYGTGWAAMVGQVRTALMAQSPVVINLTQAHNLPHVEADVFGHFVTLGGYDDSNDSYLVANGDYVVGNGVQVFGATPLYWVTGAEIANAGASGAVIFPPSNSASGGLVPAQWSPAALARLWPWMVPLLPLHVGDGSITNPWNGTTELGVDLAVPFNTPITSLTYGKVLNSFYYGGGGVVVVKAQIPNMGYVALYYQHLDQTSVEVDDVVKVGDLIGYSGGQLHGGTHPVTCCSTGPHLEIGINGGPGQWMSIGPNVDPLPYLSALVANGPTPTDRMLSNEGVSAGPVTTAANMAQGTGPIADSFSALCLALDNSMVFVPFQKPSDPSDNIPLIGGVFSATDLLQGSLAWLGQNFGKLMLRTLFSLVGLLIMLALLYHLAQPAIQTATRVATAAALE